MLGVGDGCMGDSTACLEDELHADSIELKRYC